MEESKNTHELKHWVLICVAVVAVLCFLCAAGPAFAQSGYAITWYTVDGGGAASSGGGYGLIGTAGQCDAGESTGGSYTVHGGFWNAAAEAPCPEDIDGSGAVDFGDILRILSAWGNAGGPEDLDGSGIVDFGDLLVVLANWGPCS